MPELYDEDILVWSERQAALLRRVAAGERLDDPDLDWPNIIEEIESLGRSDLHAVESLLVQALLHLLKVRAWPEAPSVPSWRAEARRFRGQARRRYTPSMRRRLDLAGLYADARAALPETIGGQPGRAVPEACFATLEALLASDTVE